MNKEQFETTVNEMYDRLKKVGYKHNDKIYDYGEKKNNISYNHKY